MKPSELRRISDMAFGAHRTVHNNGMLAWHLTKEWSGVTSSQGEIGERVRTSKVSDPTSAAALNRDDIARYHERYVHLMVDTWETVVEFADIVSRETHQSPADRETLDRVRSQMLRGVTPDPETLVVATSAVLRAVSYVLDSQDARHALKATERNDQCRNQFTKVVWRIFVLSGDLRNLIVEVVANTDEQGRPTKKTLRRERTIALCVEPACQEPVATPRRGRCEACYAWTRRWSKKNDGQPAPPVPLDVIEKRHERRAA